MNKFRKHKNEPHEYRPNDYQITIIPYIYRCSLTLVDEMFEIAKADFPFLKREDADIEQQGGRYCKGMYALTFRVPSDTVIPEDYIEADINPTMA